MLDVALALAARGFPLLPGADHLRIIHHNDGRRAL